MPYVVLRSVAALGGALLLLSPAVDAGQDATSDAALEHAKELLMSTPLIDGHNDLAWVIREETGDDIERVFAAGKIASLLGMEGGYALENSIAAE